MCRRLGSLALKISIDSPRLRTSKTCDESGAPFEEWRRLCQDPPPGFENSPVPWPSLRISLATEEGRGFGPHFGVVLSIFFWV